MSNLGSEIKQLRQEGLTYDQIKDRLGCSKGTICYHLGTNQQEKHNARKRKFRAKQHPYYSKIQTFHVTKETVRTASQLRKWYKSLSDKVRLFHKDHTMQKTNTKPTFTVEDVIAKFGEKPKCYLTGEELDIYQPRAYQFDHIVPVSRGGSNSIDNLGLCTKEANQAKSDMTLDEFIQLCKRVVETHSKS